MCSDELCTSEYTSSNGVALADVSTDGKMNQLSISTVSGFVDEIFYIQASNLALQENVLKFEINICGSEVLSLSSGSSVDFILGEQDFNQVFLVNVTSYFLNNMWTQCPFTSMNITGNSTLNVIDNSIHFFVGEAIVPF
jgi:hypothetical protein